MAWEGAFFEGVFGAWTRPGSTGEAVARFQARPEGLQRSPARVSVPVSPLHSSFPPTKREVAGKPFLRGRESAGAYIRYFILLGINTYRPEENTYRPQLLSAAAPQRPLALSPGHSC